MADINSKFKKNYSLALLTTFKIGGKAEFFIEVKEKDDLLKAVGWAKKNNEQIFIIGGGGNILVNDRGIGGLVIRLVNDDIKVKDGEVSAGAGAALSKLLLKTAAKGLSGFEWSAGIPRATLGGAIRGNAGAFGQQTAEIVKEVLAYDLKKNEFVVLKKFGCRFGYRDSIFKHKPEYIIWRAELKFKKEKPEDVKKRIAANLAFRKRLPRDPCAGSVFKNLSWQDVKKTNPGLTKKLRERGIEEKDDIINAGIIIDKLLDLKGKAIGGAQVSAEHANFIINSGGATAGDVAALISFIKTRARNELGLKLQEEIIYLGF